MRRTVLKTGVRKKRSKKTVFTVTCLICGKPLKTLTETEAETSLQRVMKDYPSMKVRYRTKTGLLTLSGWICKECFWKLYNNGDYELKKKGVK